MLFENKPIPSIRLSTASLIVFLVALLQPIKADIEFHSSGCLNHIASNTAQTRLQTDMAAVVHPEAMEIEKEATSEAETSSEYFRWTPGERSITVLHANVEFNCCLDRIFVTETWPAPRHVQLREQEETTNPCYCICPYEATTTIRDLDPGLYWIEVFVGEEQQPRGRAQIEVRAPNSSWASQCLSRMNPAQSPSLSEEEKVVFTGGPGFISVYHHNAIYNCCLDQIEIHSDLPSGNPRRLRFIEREIPNMPCDCVCPYDICTTAAGLSAGVYTAELYRETTPTLQLIASQQVEVTNLEMRIGVCTGPSTSLLSPRGSSAASSVGGVVSYEVIGDILIVRHTKASFNCCLDSLTMNLRIVDHTLYIYEKAILSGGDGCRCQCSYDLEARISGLPPGWHPVQIILDGAGGEVLDSTNIQTLPPESPCIWLMH